VHVKGGPESLVEASVDQPKSAAGVLRAGLDRHRLTPTVEEAAAGASISRTTAYRYFPNQRALLLAAHPEIDAPSLLSEGAPEDGEERFELVVEALTRLLLETELQQRTTLRLSLEPGAGEREPLTAAPRPRDRLAR
jgi:AcrR family transcriptional regulator